MTVQTSILLTDEQDAYARSLVLQGHFPSVSAVLQRGLEMLRRDVETHAAELSALQALIDHRRAEPLVPLEPSFEAFLAAVDRDA